ncbi:MAG: metallophosphoesterase family protein [Candidatus Marinarcus sp.]|uniref:metallophosphoesterase family protein n=1 Tax=Candidatus Marinarcus sp. TaxID=3100987 RepID=UPI003B00AC5B
MKIAVLSDSHLKVGYTKEVIEFLKTQGAAYIIHAGDLCTKDNLETIKKAQLPYVCVFGNNDNRLLRYAHEYNIKKEPYYFKIQEIKFKLMHLPFYLSSDDCQVVIFGHTHIFEAEVKEGTLFLNPGEVCAREKPLIEAVLLEINENEYIINYYTKEIHSEIFEKKEIRYDRK